MLPGPGFSGAIFEVGVLKIAPEKPGPGSTVMVTCDVKNTGRIAGAEVVQLYLRDMVTSVTAPMRQLKGFRKVRLEPGETKTVSLTLRPHDMSLLNGNLERVVEPGVFEVMIGKTSEKVLLRGRFTVVN